MGEEPMQVLDDNEVAAQKAKREARAKALLDHFMQEYLDRDDQAGPPILQSEDMLAGKPVVAAMTAQPRWYMPVNKVVSEIGSFFCSKLNLSSSFKCDNCTKEKKPCEKMRGSKKCQGCMARRGVFCRFTSQTVNDDEEEEEEGSNSDEEGEKQKGRGRKGDEDEDEGERRILRPRKRRMTRKDIGEMVEKDEKDEEVEEEEEERRIPQPQRRRMKRKDFEIVEKDEEDEEEDDDVESSGDDGVSEKNEETAWDAQDIVRKPLSPDFIGTPQIHCETSL
jgi:hypothetical protein